MARDSVTNTVDEELKQRRLEKKERDRIERRFRVITPAEFENNLNKNTESQQQLVDKKQNQARAGEDSWLPNQLANGATANNGSLPEASADRQD